MPDDATVELDEPHPAALPGRVEDRLHDVVLGLGPALDVRPARVVVEGLEQRSPSLGVARRDGHAGVGQVVDGSNGHWTPGPRRVAGPRIRHGARTGRGTVPHEVHVRSSSCSSMTKPIRSWKATDSTLTGDGDASHRADPAPCHPVGERLVQSPTEARTAMGGRDPDEVHVGGRWRRPATGSRSGSRQGSRRRPRDQARRREVLEEQRLQQRRQVATAPPLDWHRAHPVEIGPGGRADDHASRSWIAIVSSRPGPTPIALMRRPQISSRRST